MLLRALVVPALIGGLFSMAGLPAGGDVVRALADTAGVRSDTTHARADSVREFRGTYERGFEVSWFHPCNAPPGDDTWWVTLTDDALRQRDSLAKLLPAHSGAAIVRWRATISPVMPMGAGHMGRGSRYMLVSQVISLTASNEAGCTTT